VAEWFRFTTRFFWQIDPGYFRLKLAFKTVLAIVLSLWWTHNQTMITQLMAATATGFSMQGVVAKDFYRRVFQVLILSVSYFAAFMLGLWARESTLFTSLVLIGMAFVVNYCRRFHLRYSTAPMMVWMLCFIATVLPFPSREVAISHIDGLIKGLSVSALVLLFVWPENYKRLFRQNSTFYFSLLCDHYRSCARWLATIQVAEELLPVKSMREELSYPLESNRKLETSQTLTRNNPQMLNATAQEHALNQAFFLLTEALLNLQRKKEFLPPTLIPLLVDILNHAAKLFEELDMDKNLKLSGNVDQRISMKSLNQQLSELDITEPQVVMNLMNIKMAIQLINQHIQQWVTLNERQ
jgi:hypothetical protein